MIKRNSIGQQAAARLILSLGLLVFLIAASSISIYQAALNKASETHMENQVAFFSARLEQLERDWEIQSRAFKVRLEFTRMLEDPETAVANFQAFMTVQGTDRRFHYLLIQTEDGQKLFDFGKDLNLPSIPTDVRKGLGHYLDKEKQTLYRVFEMPIWLGAERGMGGRCAVFFRIDNALLRQLGSPNVTISAIHNGMPVASSGGHLAIDHLQQISQAKGLKKDRVLPWILGEKDHPIQLYIDAPVFTLFSSLELAICMSLIPVVDGLVLWFTVGVWLMRQTRRVTELSGAVGEYISVPQLTGTMKERLERAKEDQIDEIAEVANAIRTMVESIDRREQEREEAITRLRQSETRIREITTALGDGVLVIDTGGIITFANPWAERLLGFTKEELIGKDGHETLHHHVSSNKCQLFRAVNNQQEYRDEMEHFIRKDGSLLPVAVAATPIYRKSNFGGTVITFQDMTKLLAAQKTLHEAKTEAERANKAKSEFMANMSHEIRTPMNAIIGLSDLALGMPGINHSLSGYLSKIRISSMALLSIINDILDYSKIEAGQMEIEAVDFHLQNLLMNVTDLVNVHAGQKGLNVVLNVDSGVPAALVGDPLRLSQVLNNLVGNAVKFTETGEVCIDVAKLDEQDDKITVRFSVRDTGIGMSEEQIKHLFQPFTQADGSITRRFGGTGLGLAICKYLVEKMGGNLQVDSEIGKGSCFSFAIELQNAGESYSELSSVELYKRFDNDRQQVYRGLFEQAAPIRGAHVLLVEDNEINQTVANDLLVRMGLRVTIAGDGEQALDLLQQQMFDVVLMDIQMMLMDGFETTRRIRETPRFAELPVIAMTAAVLDKDREACEEAGMNDHVAKPIMPQNLLAVLLKWIKIDDDGLLTFSRISPANHGGVFLPELQGEDDLSERLIKLFGEQFADADKIISQLIKTGKLSEAAMQLHKIKGAAGNLGANELQEAANILESALDLAISARTEMTDDAGERADENLAIALPSFRKALAEVIEFAVGLDLEKPATKGIVESECDNCDWQRVGRLFGELRGLVDNYDFVPQELLVELWNNVGCRSLKEKVDKCRSSLEIIDYEAAKRMLDEISG